MENRVKEIFEKCQKFWISREIIWLILKEWIFLWKESLPYIKQEQFKNFDYTSLKK